MPSPPTNPAAAPNHLPKRRVTASQPSPPRLRGWSHQVAFGVAVVCAPVLIARAPEGGSRWITAIYAVAIVGLFGVSALYHRRRWSERGRLAMKRLDHSMIFVAIAATYTPIAAFVLPTETANWILPTVWLGALGGIAARLLWPRAPYPMTALPYLALGWVGVTTMPAVYDGMGTAGFVLIVVGGALFTIGAVFYALHRPNPWPRWFGYHEIFHLFVIGGAAAHYVAIAFSAVPKAS